ncbi:hypothetical protein IWQ60_007451 [Tieghemiomyces parasiticus]|uniref:Uncharacterized protein n=1 Tax=Tieghemiomyces parasiticus TaxID=78921 RepID=A0A9W8DUC2_9FUNG|nr:hypothetical protein IWQ60_007451 [Tieghemiomyces parasiticus]
MSNSQACFVDCLGATTQDISTLSSCYGGCGTNSVCMQQCNASFGNKLNHYVCLKREFGVVNGILFGQCLSYQLILLLTTYVQRRNQYPHPGHLHLGRRCCLDFLHSTILTIIRDFYGYSTVEVELTTEKVTFRNAVPSYMSISIYNPFETHDGGPSDCMSKEKWPDIVFARIPIVWLCLPVSSAPSQGALLFSCLATLAGQSDNPYILLVPVFSVLNSSEHAVCVKDLGLLKEAVDSGGSADKVCAWVAAATSELCKDAVYKLAYKNASTGQLQRGQRGPEDFISQVDRQGFPRITEELDFLIQIADDDFTIASPFRNPDHYQAQGQ